MIDILRWPCIILASQRTGSSALVKLLAERYNVPYYLEPFEQQTHLIEEVLPIYKNPGAKFILKCMVDRIAYHRVYNELMHRSDAFKIRLYRQNTVAQVASMYIAGYTGNWFGNQLANKIEENIAHYKVPVNYVEILKAAKLIVKNNNLFRLNRYKCDVTISYESLGILDENIWKRTTLPINYNDIIHATHNVLKQQRIQNNFTPDL